MCRSPGGRTTPSAGAGRRGARQRVRAGARVRASARPPLAARSSVSDDKASRTTCSPDVSGRKAMALPTTTPKNGASSNQHKSMIQITGITTSPSAERLRPSRSSTASAPYRRLLCPAVRRRCSGDHGARASADMNCAKAWFQAGLGDLPVEVARSPRREAAAVGHDPGPSWPLMRGDRGPNPTMTLSHQLRQCSTL
jgi:hypothetical protein